ncbi:MAG: hypothetical protein WAM85_19700 [Terracidiphilus sp.]
MYNRYVDGLATWQPQNSAMYAQMGKHLAEQGYTTRSIRQQVGADLDTAKVKADS